MESTTKPRLLDLFCGAGGAAMGYARAGFEVVGVDIHSQPHYPFEFYQGSALDFPLDGFDVVHASPPCQRFSKTAFIHPEKDHPDLLQPIRSRLQTFSGLYVIENVVGAKMDALMLCGTMFGLRVLRHRLFESNALLFAPTPCHHVGGVKDGTYVCVAGHMFQADEGRAAMGIDWMPYRSLAQAIPPAYTEWLGHQLMAALFNIAA